MMSDKMMILLKGNACTEKFGSYEFENQICEYGLLAFASDLHFEKTVLSFWNVKNLWFCNLHEHLEEMLCENRNYVYSNFISRPLWTKLSIKCNHMYNFKLCKPTLGWFFMDLVIVSWYVNGFSWFSVTFPCVHSC